MAPSTVRKQYEEAAFRPPWCQVVVDEFKGMPGSAYLFICLLLLLLVVVVVRPRLALPIVLLLLSIVLLPLLHVNGLLLGSHVFESLLLQFLWLLNTGSNCHRSATGFQGRRWRRGWRRRRHCGFAGVGCAPRRRWRWRRDDTGVVSGVLRLEMLLRVLVGLLLLRRLLLWQRLLMLL